MKSVVEVYPNFPSHEAKTAPKTRGVVKILRNLFYFNKNTTGCKLIWQRKNAENLEGIGRPRSVDPAWSLLRVTLNLISNRCPTVAIQCTHDDKCEYSHNTTFSGLFPSSVMAAFAFIIMSNLSIFLGTFHFLCQF